MAARFGELNAITDDLKWDDWTLENFIQPASRKWHVSYGFETGGKLCGYSIASVAGSSVHIHRYMFGAIWRRKGLGGQALEVLCDVYARQGFASATVKAGADNNAAIRFYEKHRFCRVTESSPKFPKFERKLT